MAAARAARAAAAMVVVVEARGLAEMEAAMGRRRRALAPPVRPLRVGRPVEAIQIVAVAQRGAGERTATG